jgi:hypothetical protein
MFPFCSDEVKQHLPTRKPVFPAGRPQKSSPAQAVWKSGKSVCWKVVSANRIGAPASAAIRR